MGFRATSSAQATKNHHFESNITYIKAMEVIRKKLSKKKNGFSAVLKMWPEYQIYALLLIVVISQNTRKMMIIKNNLFFV